MDRTMNSLTDFLLLLLALVAVGIVYMIGAYKVINWIMKEAVMIWNIVKSRLGEASTWKGLLSMLAGLGMALNVQQIEAITAAMVSVYVALSVILPDQFGKK